MPELGNWTAYDALPDPTYAQVGSAPYEDVAIGDTEAILRRYRQRLETSKRWREDEGYDNIWKRLIDLYRGRHYAEDEYTDRDRLMINVAFSTKNVISPSVAINYPKIIVTARQEAAAAQAELSEAVLNYWWQHFDLRKPIRRVVDDSIIVGHGWIKVGWRFDETEREATDEEWQEEYDRLRAEADLAAEQDPASAGSIPTDDEIIDSLADFRVPETTLDRPFVERVSPFDIYIDPEASDLESLKWIAQRIVLPLEQVQADERYDKKARKHVQPTKSVNARWREQEHGGKVYDDDIKRVELWEWYDLQHQSMCVFATGCDRFLVEPTEMPYPYGHPFVLLSNYDVPEFFYSIGDLEMLEPLQAEINETRTSLMNDRKRYRRKYIGRRGELDDQAVEAIESDADGVVMLVDGEHPLSEILQPLPTSDIRPELYQYGEQMLADVELVSGVSEYQRGALSEIRRTATEASIIQDAANARAADKLANVENFMAEVAQRLLKLAQTFLAGEHVARLTGPGDEQFWLPFDREAIAGDYDFEVEAGSTQPRNESTRQQRALQLLQILQPFVDVHVNGTELLRYVLRDGFGIRNPDKMLLDPMQQMMMQMMQGGMMPPGAEGAPAEGGVPPDQTAPPDGGASATTLPLDGPSAIPPEILTQLQGQVGLDLGTM